MDFKTIWANKCEILQLYIDHRLALFGVISAGLLFYLVYFSLPEPSHLNVVKTIQFWIPFGFVAGGIIASVYFMSTPVPPPQDGELYVMLTQLGCSQQQEGEILLETIEKELSRVQAIAPKLRVRRSAIQETVRDEATASKLGQNRSVHFVIYGQLRATKAESGKVAYSGGIAQAWPFQRTTSLRHYAIGKSFDAYEAEQVKALSRDIVVKLLKLYHASVGEMRLNQISFSRIIRPGVEVFDLGSNLIQNFTIGIDSAGQPFLTGRSLPNGKLAVSGRLFDSDGAHMIEIIDNRIVTPSTEKFFDVRYSGESFYIRDSYDRLLLQIKKEENLEAFAEAYLQAWKSSEEASMKEIQQRLKRQSEHLPPHLRNVPTISPLKRNWEQEKKELILINAITTVTGEIYSPEGIPMAFIEPTLLLQYTTVPMRIPGLIQME